MTNDNTTNEQAEAELLKYHANQVQTVNPKLQMGYKDTMKTAQEITKADSERLSKGSRPIETRVSLDVSELSPIQPKKERKKLEKTEIGGLIGRALKAQ